MEIVHIAAFSLLAVAFCLMEAEGRPNSKGLKDRSYKELTNILRRKYKRIHGHLHEVIGEFEIPEGFQWGSNQWLEYERDGNGHGHDIINNGNVDVNSDLIGLFGSFEIMKDGKVIKPYIDMSSITVQGAQNHDHHYRYTHHTGQIRKRNFNTEATLWDKGIIPYEIDTNTITKASDHDIIRESIAEMNNLTCLQIIPRDQAPNLPHSSFIRFTDDNDGCASWVGRVQPTNQDIGLDDAENCVEKTTVLHEIMHAIGMDHEQQRQDRDNYIEMLWNNIRGGQNNNNMAKAQTADRNAYDVESIMQYGLYSFAINEDERTMRLLDSRLEFLVDTAKGLTFYDVKDITAGYNCTQNCTSASTPVCTNEGFVGHTCQCICPHGLKGTTCQDVDSDADCGGVITLSSGGNQVIESPNYPNNHPLDKICVWLIKSPQGTNVSMEIEEMDLRYNSNENRCHHWLEIRYNLMGQSGPKRCGNANTTTSNVTDSNSNLMMLRFDSRFSKDVSANKGFRVRVSVNGDGTTSSSQPCDSNPCNNGGTCTNSGNSFTCQCTTGWSGNTCQQQAQPCDSSPCQNGGTCTNNGNSFSCTCATGWSGTNCTVRPCDSSPCQNGGTCTNNGNSFSCTCATGWSGTTCTVRPCDSSPCQNGGTCTNNGNSFSCTCATGWSGTTCTVRPCDSSPCQNGGTCTNNGNSFTCACATGWSGTTCTVRPCDSSPCQNGGTCTNNGDSFTCTCATGWSGTTCTVRPCDSSPCQHDGTCTNNGASFTCSCVTGWSGATCQTSVTSTSTCSFEPSTNCFLKNDYTPTLATQQTLPTSAPSGNYFILPDPNSLEIVLSINQTIASLVQGQQYCLGYNYTIGGTGSDVEIGVASEADTYLENPVQYWNSAAAWTTAKYSFTATSGSYPVVYIYIYEVYAGEYGAVDDVTLSSGSC